VAGKDGDVTAREEAKEAGATAGTGTAKASAAHPEGVPLLCGGPDAVPLQADALNASTLALYANPKASFKPWEEGFTWDDVEATAKNINADKAQADIHMLVTVSGDAAGGPAIWMKTCGPA
jgi:hypothetical protein